MSQNTAPSFAALGVPAEVVDVLNQQGLTSAFPIQADTLPDSLAGRDVLGRGRTGSGKTLAFVLPLIARLSASRRGGNVRDRQPRGLILAPTRELATQITHVIEPLGRSLGLTTTAIFGGVSQGRQVTALRAGVDIVVACPGRLEDLMRQRLISLDRVEITVLDEADHMADLGFMPGVRRIMSATPAHGQRLLFSATLDSAVRKLVDEFMDSPTTHAVDSGQPAVSKMTHHCFLVQDPESKREVVELLASGRSSRLLFTRTKHQAKRLAQQLTKAGIPAVDMHGNLSQNAREKNLSAFSSGKVKVLVATDIAARGLHIDDVELVVHVDPPADFKAYLHRSGRTARAGAAGNVVTVVLPNQRQEMRALARNAKIKVSPQQVDAGSREVADLVGDQADYVDPNFVKPHEETRVNTSGRAGGSRRSGSGGRGQRGANGGSDNRRAPAAYSDGGRAPKGTGRSRANTADSRSRYAERSGSSGRLSDSERSSGSGRGAGRPRRHEGQVATWSGGNRTERPERSRTQRSEGRGPRRSEGQGRAASSYGGGRRRGR